MTPRVALRSSLLLGLALAAGCSAPPGEGETVAGEGESLIGGTLDNGPNPSPAVYMQSVDSACTAAVLAPTVILTGAHCLGDGHGGITPSYGAGRTVYFSHSASVSSGTPDFEKATVQQAYLFPTYAAACAASSTGCGEFSQLPFTGPDYAPDVGILFLSTALPPDFKTTVFDPSPVNPGDSVTLAGYGCESSINADAQGPRGNRKIAIGTVADTSLVNEGGTRVADVDAFGQNYFLVTGKNAGGAASICPGDSGGPVFRGSTPGTNAVVGVNAYYTFKDTSGVATYNVLARTTNPLLGQWITYLLGNAPTAVPSKPTNVNAYWVSGEPHASLVWDPSAGVTRIEVTRTPGVMTPIAGASGYFEDDTVTPGATYSYDVCFRNDYGVACTTTTASEGSNAPLPAPMPYLTPTNVQVTGAPLAQQMVTWLELPDYRSPTFQVQTREWSPLMASAWTVAASLPSSARSATITVDTQTQIDVRVCAVYAARTVCSPSPHFDAAPMPKDDGAKLPPTTLARDGSFEWQRDATHIGWPWVVTQGHATIAMSAGSAHGGYNSAVLSGASGQQQVAETVAVRPNTSYVASVWTRSTGLSGGYFGVRDAANVELGISAVSASSTWTQTKVSFYSGARTRVSLFAGYLAGAASSLTVDDVALVEAAHAAPMSASPTSASLLQGGSTHLTITVPWAAATADLTFHTNVLPLGVTAAFGAPYLAASGLATVDLTLTGTTTTALQTFALVVTATEANGGATISAIDGVAVQVLACTVANKCCTPPKFYDASSNSCVTLIFIPR